MVRENTRPGAAEQAAPGFLRLGPRSSLCSQECGSQGAHILLAGGMEIAGSHHIRFQRSGPPPTDGAVRPASAGGAPPAGRLAREGGGSAPPPGGWGGRGLCGCWPRRSSPTGNCWRPGVCGGWTRCRFSGSTPVSWPLRSCSGRVIAPQRGTVALRGRRVDRDMVRAAEFLCPRVRELAVSARKGGEELSSWLRREYGMPVRPDGEGITAAIRFDKDAPAGGGRELFLYGGAPQLVGVRPRGGGSGRGGPGGSASAGRPVGDGTAGGLRPRIYLTEGRKVTIITHTASVYLFLYYKVY